MYWRSSPGYDYGGVRHHFMDERTEGNFSTGGFGFPDAYNVKENWKSVLSYVLSSYFLIFIYFWEILPSEIVTRTSSSLTVPTTYNFHIGYLTTSRCNFIINAFRKYVLAVNLESTSSPVSMLSLTTQLPPRTMPSNGTRRHFSVSTILSPGTMRSLGTVRTSLPNATEKSSTSFDTAFFNFTSFWNIK